MDGDDAGLGVDYWGATPSAAPSAAPSAVPPGVGQPPCACDARHVQRMSYDAAFGFAP